MPRATSLLRLDWQTGRMEGSINNKITARLFLHLRENIEYSSVLMMRALYVVLKYLFGVRSEADIRSPMACLTRQINRARLARVYDDMLIASRMCGCHFQCGEAEAVIHTTA